mgnify:CR=1 FL=1
MSEISLALVMASQAVFLALISRVRWRCFPDPETGRCTMVSGCTDQSLMPSSDSVQAEEFVIGADQRVLLVNAKT